MTPWLQDPDVTLYHGDCLQVLRELPSSSVHMCATSPPFYGLRDYGTGEWEGGNPECDHLPRRGKYAEGCIACGINMNQSTPGCAHCADRHLKRSLNQTPETDWRPYDPERKELPNPPAGWAQRDATVAAKHECGKCGARRVDKQIGLEDTPDQWVENLVSVFREVRRVLRDDGTLWVEIGDSYASTAPGTVVDPGLMTGKHVHDGAYRRPPTPPRTKPKDLLGQPWLLAFALRADGWWLRSEIIWARPNPMPESVTDRPTKSHSTVFLLSKNPRYFYDADAIREAPNEASAARYAYGFNNGSGAPPGQPKYEKAGTGVSLEAPSAGANARSVWTIPTQPTPFAHFATWPEALVRRMILAGTSEKGCCPECGAPWVRDVHAETANGNPTRRKPAPLGAWLKEHRLAAGLSMTELTALVGAHGAVNHGGAVSNWEQNKNVPTSEQWASLKGHLGFGDDRDGDLVAWHEYERSEWGTTPDPLTHGAPSAAPADLARRVVGVEWVPSCQCHFGDGRGPRKQIPCTVLDPFAGSATTMLVARNHGRHSIGIELNETYLKIAGRRLQQLSLLA